MTRALPRTIDRLRLTAFRCYGAVALDAGPGAVVITGDNGAGKTNLLEAVSMLSPGRGLRGAALTEMAKSGGDDSFAISATLGCGEDVPVTLGTGTRAARPRRREVRINGAPASAAALSQWLSVLWLTPAMDRLFVDSAGARRRFLDRLALALFPGHAQEVQRYEAAMRARNRLLAEDVSPDPDWLAGLEAQMGAHGAALAAHRANTVAALGVVIEAMPAGEFPKAALTLSGDDWRDAGQLQAALATARAADAAAGRATRGPHKADLSVVHSDKGEPAARASTGEQKALLLGIVLAHAHGVAARSGRRPVLLLDEVAAHLDETRRAALFARLADLGTQVWMTGTDVSLFRAIGNAATYIEVSNARLSTI